MHLLHLNAQLSPSLCSAAHSGRGAGGGGGGGGVGEMLLSRPPPLVYLP